MTFLIVAVAFTLGTGAGAVLLQRIHGMSPHHVDYKKRWEEAISLLDGEGRLSQDQVDQLAGKPPKPAEAPYAAGLLEIYKMSSVHRRDIEVVRAQKGLPPYDDLSGMTSVHKRDVLAARAKAEIRRIAEEES